MCCDSNVVHQSMFDSKCLNLKMTSLINRTLTAVYLFGFSRASAVNVFLFAVLLGLNENWSREYDEWCPNNRSVFFFRVVVCKSVDVFVCHRKIIVRPFNTKTATIYTISLIFIAKWQWCVFVWNSTLLWQK